MTIESDFARQPSTLVSLTGIDTNIHGGKGSRIQGAFHLIGTRFLNKLSERMKLGSERYSLNNWRKCPPEEHLDHMMEHIMNLRNGDVSEDHLGGIAARCMMFVETWIDGGALTDDQIRRRYGPKRRRKIK